MNELGQKKSKQKKSKQTITIDVEDYKQLLYQLEEAHEEAVKVKKEKSEFFSWEFWDSVATKLLTTFISVKVWALLLSISVPGFLLIKGYITGANFATIVVGVWTVVLGAREYFKVASVKTENGSATKKDNPMV